MKKINLVSLILVSGFWLLITLVYAQEETITITTYYPAPYGSYAELRADRISVGSGSGYRTATIPADGLIVQGNVGIGTTSPGTQLEIFSATDGAGPLLLSTPSPDIYLETGATHYNWRIAAQEDVDEGLTIGSGAKDNNALDDTYTTHLTILRNGNVGIGMTEPSASLDVRNAVSSQPYAIKGQSTFSPTATYPESIGIRGADYGLKVKGVLGRAWWSPDGIIWKMAVNGSAEPETGVNNYAGYFQGKVVVVDSSAGANDGNVGIGTTSPTNKLHVVDRSPWIVTQATSDNPVGVTIQRTLVGGSYNTNWSISMPPSSKDLWIDNPPSGNKLVLTATGKVGIGTTTQPVAKLEIKTAENGLYCLIIRNADNNAAIYAWPDSNGNGILGVTGELRVDGTILNVPEYVFEPNYKLMALHELEEYIKQNKHLPDIPLKEEIKTNGLNLSETMMKLLAKIEELTLYTIEQQKQIESLKAEITSLKHQL